MRRNIKNWCFERKKTKPSIISGKIGKEKIQQLNPKKLFLGGQTIVILNLSEKKKNN